MNPFAGYRDAELIAKVATEIKNLELPRRIRIMEVCGGHTAAIYRFALHSLLPDTIELLSGPGCPVCVTPNSFIDHAIELAKLPDTVIATFGDLIRVPGTHLTLSAARAQGCDIRVFYSSADALEFAHENPRKRVIFLGVGFETTASTIASTMEHAVARGDRNFRLLSALKTMPGALNTLLSSSDVRVDGLILPGHVVTVAGTEPFEFIANSLHIPCAVAGFEPLDLMQSILAIATQTVKHESVIENKYRRAVRASGNVHAQRAMKRMFEETAIPWRGLGEIADSGLKLRSEFVHYDASTIEVTVPPSKENPACRCGEVLRGIVRPAECALFGTRCTPHSPVGACMVSSEGACAAVYYFQPEHVH
ncbi:MAG: hydrogenase formation protein HypD [bacterium]|nr:hydrogenase formation protein HypD [bacterium]